MGWEAGYDSKRGFSGHYGRGMVQEPASTATLGVATMTQSKRWYDRKTLPNGKLLVTGCQQLSLVGSDTNSNANAFLFGGTRTNSILLSPDTIGGQMATDARNYATFNFRKVRLEVALNYPFTDTVGFALSYTADPAQAGYQTQSYSSIQGNKDNIVRTRKANTVAVLNLTQLQAGVNKKFYTEADVTNSSTTRLTNQGEINMFFSAMDSSNTNGGEVLIVYELELSDRTSDYGFTMVIRDRQIATLLVEALLREEDRRFHKFFEKDKDVKGEKDLSPDQTALWFSERAKWVKSRFRLSRDVHNFLDVPTIGTAPLLATQLQLFSDGSNLYSNKPNFDNATGVLLVGTHIFNTAAGGWQKLVGQSDSNGYTVGRTCVVGNSTSSAISNYANYQAIVSTSGSLQTVVSATLKTDQDAASQGKTVMAPVTGSTSSAPAPILVQKVGEADDKDDDSPIHIVEPAERSVIERLFGRNGPSAVSTTVGAAPRSRSSPVRMNGMKKAS